MPQKTVLLANKDRDSLNIHREFLEKKGLILVTASSVEEVLQICHAASHPFQLAILDARLRNETDERDGSGFDLAKHLASICNIPTIVLTLFDEGVHHPPVAGGAAITFIRKQDGLFALYDAVVATMR